MTPSSESLSEKLKRIAAEQRDDLPAPVEAPPEAKPPPERKKSAPPVLTAAGKPEFEWEQSRKERPAAVAYLEARGIGISDAQAIHLEFVSGQEAGERLGLFRNDPLSQAAYAILLPDPNSQTYYHAIGFRFDKHGNLEKPIKRVSYKKTHEQDYIFLPHISGQTYEALPLSVAVVVCESYIKALDVRKAGYIAVVTNGVYGFSRGDKQPVKGMSNPVFQQGRKIVLLTDSLNLRNERSARNVLRARRVHMTRLRQALTSARVSDPEARLFTADPPNPPEGTPEWEKGDEGIDSVYMRGGLEAVMAIINTAPLAEFISELEEKCEDISEKYVWADELNRGIDRRHGTVLTKQALVEAVAQTTYTSIDGKGKVTIREVYPEWRKWKGRPHIRTVRFLPGQDQLIEPSHAQDDRNDFNMWDGFAVEPWTEQSDIDAALDNFDKHYVQVMVEAVGADEAMTALSMLAHMIQNPDQIQNQFIYACGPAGAGKSYLFMRPLQLLLGKHCAEVTIQQYTNHFNKVLAMARAVLLNEGTSEVYAPMAKDQAELFATLLKKEADAAELTRRIEPKGVDSSTIDKCALAVVLGNHLPNFTLDEAIARRMLFLLFSSQMMMRESGGEKTLSWWTPHWEWMNSPRAARDLMTCLTKWDWSACGYTASGQAYQTEAFVGLMVQRSFKSAEDFARSLRRSPKSTLMLVGISEAVAGAVTHVTASDIVDLFKLMSPTSGITAIGLGAKLTPIFGSDGAPAKNQLNGKWADGRHPRDGKAADGKPRNEACWSWGPIPEEMKPDQFRVLNQLRDEIQALTRAGALKRGF